MKINEWEYLLDRDYFNKWAVRRKNNGSDNAIHVSTHGEAEFLTRKLNENDKLSSMCRRAADEITEFWDSHCNADGTGLTNLVSRLRGDIPPDYYLAYLDDDVVGIDDE